MNCLLKSTEMRLLILRFLGNWLFFQGKVSDWLTWTSVKPFSISILDHLFFFPPLYPLYVSNLIFHIKSSLLFHKKKRSYFYTFIHSCLPNYLNINSIFSILQQNSIFALSGLFTRRPGMPFSVSLKIQWCFSVPPWITYMRLQVLFLSQIEFQLLHLKYIIDFV